MSEVDDIQRALDVAIAAKRAQEAADELSGMVQEHGEVWAVDAVEDEVAEIVTSHNVAHPTTTLSRITPVRFDQVTYNAVTAVAAAEEMTASAWIRRAVKRQLDREDV